MNSSAGTAAIELGVYGYGDGPDDAPERGRSRSIRARLVLRRRWLGAALLAAMVGSLSGAAAAPDPQLVRLWTVADIPVQSIDVTAVDGERLYAITGLAGSPLLTAYRLADGAVLWEAPLDLTGRDELAAFPDSVGIQVDDGVVLVQDYFAPEVTTTAYDSHTAQPLWSGEGLPYIARDGWVTLRSRPPVQDPDEPETPVLAVRDLSSGAVRGSFEGVGDAADFWQAPDGALHLLMLADDGLLSSYDLTADAVANTVVTPYQRSRTDGFPVAVRVIADMVMVSDWESGGTVAYDAATLERRWALEDVRSPMPCGPVVCLTQDLPWEDPDRDLRAVDPATGAVRWSMDCADGGVSEGCALFARELEPGDRLVVELGLLDSRPGEPESRYWLVDAATGRQLTEPTAWAVRPQDGSTALLSLGTGVRAQDAEYWREQDIEPHRLWWARSDPALSRIEVLGVVEADWCTPHEPYLVCRTQDEQVEVWRIGP